MQDSRKKVGVVLHSVEGRPWGTLVKDDIERTLANHPELRAEFADPRGSADAQIEILERLLNQGIDALIVYPIDGQRTRAVLGEYRKADVPVIVVGNDLGEPDLYRSLIVADNRQFGRTVGAFFAEVMGGRGELVEIEGVPTTSAAVDRSAGFREALAQTPGMRIVESCSGNWLYEPARREFSRILAHRARIDAVFAHGDEMARGAWEAAAEAGREQEMLIAGIDAIRGERGIQMVRQGRLAATFINPSPGKAAVEAVAVTLAGGTCLPRRLLFTSPFRSLERIRAWQAGRQQSGSAAGSS
jgi:ABC-type sugar transport system substrate-binding protein